MIYDLSYANDINAVSRFTSIKCEASLNLIQERLRNRYFRHTQTLQIYGTIIVIIITIILMQED